MKYKPQQPDCRGEIEAIFNRMMAKFERIEREQSRQPAEAPEPAPKPPPLPPFPGAFCLHGVADCVRQAHSKVEVWVRDAIADTAEPRWLTLFGKSGSGKSHLACLAHYLLRKVGVRTVLRSWPTVQDALLKGDTDVIKQLGRAPVLLLDDFGTGYPTGDRRARFLVAKLFELFELRRGKWTLFTGMLTPQDISEQIDQRIASRLFRDLNELVDMRDADDWGYCNFRHRTNHTDAENSGRG